MAFTELVRLAIYLDVGREIPGYARVRNALRRDLREEIHLHASIQLEVAHLARAMGADVALEERTRSTSGPVDVRFTIQNVRLRVETKVVLHDDVLREGRELSDRVSATLHAIMFRHDVFLVGAVGEELAANNLASLTQAVEVAAVRAAADGVATRVEHDLALDLKAIPHAQASSGMTFELPAGTGIGWERTVRILRTKAAQATAAGATWLRVDLLDGMWQLTPWAAQPL